MSYFSALEPFWYTAKSRLIFRSLRGTFINLNIVNEWAPLRFDTHHYCTRHASHERQSSPRDATSPLITELDLQ